MEKLSSKEFFEQLKANTLKPAFTLKGIVKKSDKDAEVLFAKKGNFGKWISIPAAMIESVVVLKSFSKENTTYTVVKLHLKKPTTPEGQVLYDLISSMDVDDEKNEKSGKGNFMGGLMDRFGHMGCHMHGMGCHMHGCGCLDHSCGCHDHSCGCQHCSCSCHQNESGCKSESKGCGCQKENT